MMCIVIFAFEAGFVDSITQLFTEMHDYSSIPLLAISIEFLTHTPYGGCAPGDLAASAAATALIR